MRQYLSVEEVLEKYPRLSAALIAESCGYFTPLAAANALQAYREGRECWCEWYLHISNVSKLKLSEVGKQVLVNAIQHRHFNRRGGYLQSALATVRQCPQAQFMSW